VRLPESTPLGRGALLRSPEFLIWFSVSDTCERRIFQPVEERAHTNAELLGRALPIPATVNERALNQLALDLRKGSSN
jgi:hypothetical protein